MTFIVPKPISVRADEVVALKESGAESDYLKSVVVTQWNGPSVVISFPDDGALGDLGALALSLLDDSRSYEEVFSDRAVAQHAEDVSLRPTAGELLPQTAADRSRKEARVRFTFGDAKVDLTARVEDWQKLLRGVGGIS